MEADWVGGRPILVVLQAWEEDVPLAVVASDMTGISQRSYLSREVSTNMPSNDLAQHLCANECDCRVPHLMPSKRVARMMQG
eukprot:3684894-Amphidinium_carterae.1